MAGFPEKSPSTLGAVFDSVPDLIVVYDGNGRYLDVLAGHQVLSFQSPKELIGRNVQELLDEETARTILDGIDRALSTGETQTIEYEIELAGQSFWFEGRIAAIDPEDPDEDPDRVVFIARDISQRRRQEQELERQNERLEEFAEVVSHDLRSPLSVLDGSLELAEETGKVEHFRRCHRAIDRMEQLIEDLLALAREDELANDLEPVALASVAREAWDTVETGAATLDIAGETTVHADRGRLRQLLENLFGNAVEHGSTSPDSQARQDAVEHGSTSPDSQARPDAVEHGSTSPDSQARQDAVEHGGTDVTVRVGPADGGFYVADDGPGIPPEERDRVFERGVSIDDGGTGFGLAIVRRIAEAHGWTVAATGSEDGGARFEVTGVTTPD